MQSITQPFTITVSITAQLAGISLSPTTVSTVGPNNAGAVVGAITVTTNPPGGSTANVTLSLSGTDAGKFRLSSTVLPSNLVVGPINVAAGSYSVTVAASTP